MTGIVLVFVRTSFDVSTFSAKLWLKIGLMTVMLFNSYLIGRVVLPVLKENIGQPMVFLRPMQLVAITQIAVLSLFGWTSGLMLGSSVFLKTAAWDVLLPLSVAWFVLLTLCGQSILFFIRREQPAFSGAER